MPSPARSQQPRTDGDWWVLLVTDGLMVELPPELYREHADAEREAERWARVLSSRSGAGVERPFSDRWEVGDVWIRLVSSFLPEERSEIWVGTYWTRDGSPDPEAELFSSGADARAWAQEHATGAVIVESHDTPWSAWARYRIRGGEEEAEVHRAKIVASLSGPPTVTFSNRIFHGFQVSDGLMPQIPELFSDEATRDQAMRSVLVDELMSTDWQDFVLATAERNYVSDDLPPEWNEEWDQASALDWLLGFDFISDGDDLEIRRFDASLPCETDTSS